MWKTILKALAGTLLILITVVLINTFRKTSTQTKYTAKTAPEVSETALQNLKTAIGIKTISYTDTTLTDTSAFTAFSNFLAAAYPAMQETLVMERIKTYTLMYTWTGTNPGLNPIILMAHQDVVPIEEASRNQWTVDPFGGVVKEGFIWGRGSADDKINLISICEGVNKLLLSGYRPERTVILLFGHDEEIGGSGAKMAAQLLEQRGVRAEMVLDEGGIITREKLPGMNEAVALLGTAEKGYLSLKLTSQVIGGHSSMPEKETALDVLSKAIVTLRSQPFPARFTAPMYGLMAALGPEMPFTSRMAFANPWLFKGLIASTYEKTGAGNAMLHTTLVPTIINAGMKDNVVPTQAVATINLRLLPGDSIAAIIKQVENRINDPRIKIEKYEGTITEASGVSPKNGYGYTLIDRIMKESYPGILTSPFLMIGGTDSRHFVKVSDNIIKFSPMIDPVGFHGIDERVSLESFRTSLWFFEQLLQNTK